MAVDLDGPLGYITIILTSISIICAFATLVTFSIFSDLRTYPIKLIMYLCLTISSGWLWFLLASEKTFSYLADTWMCWPAAILVHYFLLANFCWSNAIAFNFYQMIVRRNKHSAKLEPYYHCFSWIFPAICVVITAGNQKYGKNSSGMCYINDELFSLLLFFLPGLLIIATNSILFFFIAREIHETLAGAPQSDKREKKKECRVYLSIFVSIGIAWIFGYLMLLVPNDVWEAIFLVLFTFTVPLQGMFIFGAYCVNMKVAARWCALFGICIPACNDLADKANRAVTTSAGSGSTASTASNSTSSSSASSYASRGDN
eukprot:TRINITY_DN198_c0_g1_i1.p1 TRINITY_DN198_c0_g1~~TRINITY_DN198_c0_g1_i1.p1  ORF type:complete len:342 (-),score=100.22 TRINITY_DN198_c0_g1_i1:203-1150(-)